MELKLPGSASWGNALSNSIQIGSRLDRALMQTHRRMDGHDGPIIRFFLICTCAKMHKNDLKGNVGAGNQLDESLTI